MTETQKPLNDVDALSAEVDEFYRSTNVPPGFVIRNYGDGKWTVEYKQTVDKDTLRRVVMAVKGAMESSRITTTIEEEK